MVHDHLALEKASSHGGSRAHLPTDAPAPESGTPAQSMLQDSPAASGDMHLGSLSVGGFEVGPKPVEA